MIEQTGNDDTGTAHAQALLASKAKVGKTCFLVAQSLGVFPAQRNSQFGGVVTSPKHLHVVGVDQEANAGVKRFLLETCKAPQEALNYRFYNMQEDAKLAFTSQVGYGYAFYLELLRTIEIIREHVARMRGVHVVIPCSLTGLAGPLEREIMGPPGGSLAAMEERANKGEGAKKGHGDQDKWQRFKDVILELRNKFQLDEWHCLWEAHIEARSGPKDEDGKPTEVEGIAVSGSAGKNFASNVSQVFKIERRFGQKFKGTNCDEVYLNTRPSFDFVSNGRNFTEALREQEPDLAVALKKLGKRIGGWGAPKKTPQAPAPSKP